MKTELTIRALSFGDWRTYMMEHLDLAGTVLCPVCDGWGCDNCGYGSIAVRDLQEHALVGLFTEEMYAEALVDDLIAYAMYIGDSPRKILISHGITVWKTTDKKTHRLGVNAGTKRIFITRLLSPGYVPKTTVDVNFWDAAG